MRPARLPGAHRWALLRRARANRAAALRPRTRQRGEAGQRCEVAEGAALVLARDLICLAPGCTQAATDVDHVVPKRAGGTDDMDNLQGFCHACHSAKTAREDGRWD